MGFKLLNDKIFKHMIYEQFIKSKNQSIIIINYY